jgi:subtilisin family serine protease
VRVAILDTGIDLTNQVLLERIIDSKDLCNPVNGTCQDLDGHGTHLAGLISQVAHCKLLIGKIMSYSGFFTNDALQDGVAWAIENKADVICVASGEQFYNQGVHNIVLEALHKNIIVIAALGNHGEHSSLAGYYPARFEECLSVGAIDENGAMASFSDFNADVCSIYAPGVDVSSFAIHGKLKTESGTSMSAAYVTAVVSILISWVKSSQRPINSLEIKKKIFETAIRFDNGSMSYFILSPLDFIQSFE